MWFEANENVICYLENVLLKDVDGSRESVDQFFLHNMAWYRIVMI